MGDGKIGKATIPAAVLSAHDTKVLADATGQQACATIHSVGTIQQGSEGQIDIHTDVKIKVSAVADATVAAPPDTSTLERGHTPVPEGLPMLVLLIGLLILVASRRRAGPVVHSPGDS